MFSGICRVLSWSSLCPDTNSARRRGGAAIRMAVGQPEEEHPVSLALPTTPATQQAASAHPY